MKKIFFTILTFFVCGSIIYSQQKEYKLNEVVVTSAKSPVSFAHLARTVAVIDSSTIQSLPANNIQDILQYAGSVDLRTRGVEGVQGDAVIRGGTFEQTLILINGVKISDPQTGHHNLNIPISLQNIERIEILKGQGSRIFGPNAFGGAINIITKKGNEVLFSVSEIVGENNLNDFSVNTSYPLGIFGNSFSYSKKKSDGYRHNTDFDITNFSFNQSISFGSQITSLFFGYVDKKFGANSFYSNSFPDQWEHTTTKIFTASSDIEFANLIVSPKFYWRRNDDDYRLDNTRPGWYRNIHKTYSYGAEIQSTLKTSIGTISLSTEIANEEIKSTNLGSHERRKGGISGEFNFNPFEKLFVSTGFFAYDYAEIGWKFWPGIDAAYQLNDEIKIIASAGKAFRLPSFTELYYVSPANVGNPNLKHEEAINYEVGFSFLRQSYEASANLFYKDGKNIIDWARQSPQEPWKVENVTELKTIGTELGFTIYPQKILNTLPVTKIGLQYTYLSSDRKTGNYQSKYVLDHLRHQLLVNISHYLIEGISQNWILRFEERENFTSYFIVDKQISTHIKSFDLFLRINNLFNHAYSDFIGVQMPGRWISVGATYSLDKF
ncbi:MAG: TonB-dependent receptor [Ignavibacteriales bacterium]|nr:TonB-dependent receptor [Ignavibacteriales bacterium]